MRNWMAQYMQVTEKLNTKENLHGQESHMHTAMLFSFFKTDFPALLSLLMSLLLQSQDNNHYQHPAECIPSLSP